MRTRTHCIFIIIMALSSGIAGLAPAEQASESLAGEMARMINEARLNPAAAAESLGLNVAQLTADHPELAEIMAHGLPELAWNPRLAAAAADHVADMTQNHYYSQTSPDGRTYEQRIQEKGYAPMIAGESLGLLQFHNFIKPEKALRIVFENLLSEQFRLAPPARTILNPDYQELGVAEAAGELNQDGRLSNAYFVDCLFGAEIVMSRMDIELFHLINQARVKPLAVAESLGFNRDELLAQLPELQDILLYGLPPLTVNPRLVAAAQSRVAERVERGYSAPETDSRPISEKLADFGYQAETVAEHRSIAYYSGQIDSAKENLVIMQLLKKLLQSEFQNSDQPRFILNPAYREIGLSVMKSLWDISFLFNKAFIVMVEVGTKPEAEAKLPSLMGNAYLDLDGNHLYSPGEGLAAAAVNVYQEGMAVNQTQTSISGDFHLFLPPGWYVLAAVYHDQILAQEIFVNQMNQAVYLPFYPIPEEL